MKCIIRNINIILIVMLPLAAQGQIHFSAEMSNVRRGNKIVYMVQSNGSLYRYDFEEGGMKGCVIVNPAKQLTAILMIDKKFVHYTETSSTTSRSNDPVQALMTIRDRYTEKNSEKVQIEGYNCDKSELYADDQKIFTLWFSDELNFPLRIENHMGSDTYIELSGIKKMKIDPSVFEVPEDYTEVDERMRPIIPEPPPPESWNSIELNIPIKADYKRGDHISFNIPESTNYKVILKNNTDNPSKVIRISMRDGKELANDEQGPLSYRTKRLHGRESSTNTYSWTAGDKKIFKVYEGVMYIEIVPEER